MEQIELEVVRQSLIGQINNMSKHILINYPPLVYIGYINKYPQYITHKFVSTEIEKITTEIIKLSDLSILESYHKLILVDLMQYSIDRDLINSFPEDIKNLFFNNFKLILEKITSIRTKNGFFLNTEDKFNKYMAIARLKMIPCGAQKVYAGSLPKKIFITGDMVQFFKKISLVFRSAGIKPFFKMHMDSTDKQLMKEFNPEGWDKFFKRIGLLLKTQKNIKGVCGSSWFFDSALKKISPEISYIRDICEKYGASFFCQGTNESIIKDAIFMSPKRIKLYKQGEYTPTGYLMVITRKNLLKNLQ